ncbi:threonine/homoserine efflux transporter RhtA [Kineococcus xinjiangensis]|uniref:Threonine/homoserine efflux transporter RhtA n=1 Tax=Kineococcus xinjiangensis TaxID=512762 RepID=A0A2S6IEN5_9ACTN|nr:DMT family transporter [Kineococcus xinjiangensis]PPK92684.1 threonine/homoserine efflux transporter RhtA [Kineococcus xinjiangensis]
MPASTPRPAPRTSGRGTGLALALVSAATFGTSGAFGSALIEAGWTPGAAVTARITLAALVLTPVALVQLRGRWGLLARARGMVIAYGLVAIAGCQLAYFSALEHVSVGVALLLEYLGSILVVGWLWLRHGQRPRRLTVAGAAAAVAGLVLVLDLTGAQRVTLPGLLWGLGAAVGLAMYFLLSSRDEAPLPPLVLAWGGMCVGALALVLLAVGGLLPVRAPLVDVVLFGAQVSWLVPVLCLSLVAAVIAYAAGIGAARRLGAKVASFVGLTEVLFAVLFAWVLLGQAPAAVQFAGGALIVAGVALVRIDELRAPVAVPTAAPAAAPDLPLPAARETA